MKVLLYGKNGWIGNQVYDLLVNNTNNEVFIANERAENYKELEDEIKKPELDRGLIEDLTKDIKSNQEKINLHGKRASSIV